eukprot:CAMPEP_0118677082 /NCGR_PEP_ID=MMETSP0800-20121206/2419_1 /TAXON_ID=210618 ORGANISM="Striatella unipunctata, Strain CCMP2910" /NCGR_SAMPLE_ID=MMETSP0800 /ASSEMBLY_ACC=CAM_ASM_000638 /LENGTH=352 /DNA_ID=CAMNT_0006572695 /DNA_START=203 /DNA_END=1261 /DNA_ORIENTATION=+
MVVPEGVARFQLLSTLVSPAGKVTLNPEILIPEPNDPTAILLLSNAISQLSSTLRKGKANTAWISGSTSSLKTFCTEQQTALGNFPGPVPVVYCGNLRDASAAGTQEGGMNLDCEAIADAGASGVLLPLSLGDNQVTSIDDITNGKSDFGDLAETVASAYKNGLEVIPEITLEASNSWTEDKVMAVLDAVKSNVKDPVAIVLSAELVAEEETEGEDQPKPVSIGLPPIPSDLEDGIPILGSVRVPAGNNRIGDAVGELKTNGYKGAFLRADCIPGFRLNPDLELVGGFWSAVIGSLKSTRSKLFKFNSRNNMETSVGQKWGSLQQSVMDSGALGSPEDNPYLNADGGDYQAF